MKRVLTLQSFLTWPHGTVAPVDSPQQMDVETTALYHSLQDSQVPNLPNEILIRITHKHSVMYICRQ